MGQTYHDSRWLSHAAKAETLWCGSDSQTLVCIRITRRAYSNNSWAPPSFKLSRYKTALHYIPFSIWWHFHLLCGLYCFTHYLTSSRPITVLQFFLKTFANSLLQANGLNILQPVLASDSSLYLRLILLWFLSLYSLGFPHFSFLLPPPLGSTENLTWDSHNHSLGSLYLSLKKNTVLGVSRYGFISCTWAIHSSSESHFPHWWVMGDDN